VVAFIQKLEIRKDTSQKKKHMYLTKRVEIKRDLRGTMINAKLGLVWIMN
jgi:hypothetical protein